jgi:hypothetical protein
MAESFADPQQISTSVADGLSGTTHERTRMPFIAKGTSTSSSPTLYQQLNRLFFMLYRAINGVTAGMAFKTGTLEIGVLPFRYRKADGTDAHYEGGTLALTASNTNYVYVLHGTNALTKSTSSFPVDQTTFTPIAEYVCGGSDITTDDDDADRRGLAMYHTNSSSTSPTGTTGTAFTIDSDNAGAGVDQQVRFNRGSTDAEDAALEWDETNDRFNALEQHSTGTACPVNASEYFVSGTSALNGDGAAKVQSGVAGDGLAHAAGVLSVGVDDSTIEIDSDELQVKDGGIGEAKLSTGLADKLPQVSIPDGSGAGSATIQIQIQDAAGNDLDEVCYLEVGVFDDADGGTQAANATIAVGTAGSKVADVVANKQLRCKTNANGELDIDITDGSAETVYIVARPTYRSRRLDCADYGTVTIS